VNARHHAPAGLTLIEVLVALTLLAVGAAALSTWQISSLQAATRARQQQQLSALVDAELRYRALIPFQGPDCQALPGREGAELMTCSVTEETCALSGTDLHCGAAGQGAARIRRITVRAGHGTLPELEFSSLAADFPGP
jgi:prepilin-type N-terminal cleavage/methylation domain-containing protein